MQILVVISFLILPYIIFRQFDRHVLKQKLLEAIVIEKIIEKEHYFLLLIVYGLEIKESVSKNDYLSTPTGSNVLIKTYYSFITNKYIKTTVEIKN